jgi:hypothetical protein
MVFDALCFLSVLVISLASLPTIQIIFVTSYNPETCEIKSLFRSTSPNGHVGFYYCFVFVVLLNHLHVTLQSGVLGGHPHGLWLSF